MAIRGSGVRLLLALLLGAGLALGNARADDLWSRLGHRAQDEAATVVRGLRAAAGSGWQGSPSTELEDAADGLVRDAALLGGSPTQHNVATPAQLAEIQDLCRQRAAGSPADQAASTDLQQRIAATEGKKVELEQFVAGYRQWLKAGKAMAKLPAIPADLEVAREQELAKALDTMRRNRSWSRHSPDRDEAIRKKVRSRAALSSQEQEDAKDIYSAMLPILTKAATQKLSSVQVDLDALRKDYSKLQQKMAAAQSSVNPYARLCNKLLRVRSWVATGAAPVAPAAPVLVPDVVGQVRLDARTAIGNAGLVVGHETLLPHATVPAGRVIRQAPVAHTPVAVGTAVDLVLSTGATAVRVMVPDVQGMSQVDAVKTLAVSGLTVGKITLRKSGRPRGEVLGQDPPPFTVVGLPFAVALEVSDVARTLFIDPPRLRVTVGEEASFRALLIEDGVETDVTQAVRWTVAPDSAARPIAPGRFIARAEGSAVIGADHALAAGSATLVIEAVPPRTRYDPPISRADDRERRAEPAPADAYTWFALCDSATWDVVYGQRYDVTRHRVIAGPFPGPRTVRDWIERNVPTWRCPPAAGGGEWKVLCSRRDFSVRLGKALDVTQYWVMQEGFPGEPEARAWVTQFCPSWLCIEGGACAAGPRGGGDWTVVCDRGSGSIGLTRQPNPQRHWVLRSGLLGEVDARLWAQQSCPSWRCDADGQCIGQGSRTDASGDWTVVCDMSHGGVGLTRSPDFTRQWLWQLGLPSEPVARRWVEQNCPSWRCNAYGLCLTGVGPPRADRPPLELPPLSTGPGFSTPAPAVTPSPRPPTVGTQPPTVPPTPAVSAPRVEPATSPASSSASCPSIAGRWMRTGGGIFIISGGGGTGGSVSWIGKSGEEPWPDGRWPWYQEFHGAMLPGCHFQGSWEDIPAKSYWKNKGKIVMKIVSPRLIQAVREYQGYRTEPESDLELKR